MAFHLHRLKLVRKPLKSAGYPNITAADLSAARIPLGEAGAHDLAERLGIDVAELTRELTPDEMRVWSFYRASASNPEHVWKSARAAWKAENHSDRQAAEIIGINHAIVFRAISNPKRHILSFDHAARLTSALRTPTVPEDFLPPPKGNDPHHSR